MSDLPKPYKQIREEFPQVAEAYDALGNAIHQAGPLDDKTRQLVKLALSVGAGLEGATHAHARRSLEMGITPEEIKHVILLAMTTLGFPATVSAYTWIHDELEKK
ncbi:MAG: carboxymuconolactone decarboxylase family protein [Phototrophicales bacterium]|nr:MAG: carboxymuconolactone decarboxylase family protein [Phototrophicales bacterium]RMG69991.1 MAG: carboxymuconolactone decarboxylase family protein [Chloroflexota bacterium]